MLGHFLVEWRHFLESVWFCQDVLRASCSPFPAIVPSCLLYVLIEKRSAHAKASKGRILIQDDLQTTVTFRTKVTFKVKTSPQDNFYFEGERSPYHVCVTLFTFCSSLQVFIDSSASSML